MSNEYGTPGNAVCKKKLERQGISADWPGSREIGIGWEVGVNEL